MITAEWSIIFCLFDLIVLGLVQNYSAATQRWTVNISTLNILGGGGGVGGGVGGGCVTSGLTAKEPFQSRDIAMTWWSKLLWDFVYCRILVSLQIKVEVSKLPNKGNSKIQSHVSTLCVSLSVILIWTQNVNFHQSKNMYSTNKE